MLRYTLGEWSVRLMLGAIAAVGAACGDDGPAPRKVLVSATGAGGEGCAAVTYDKGAGAWSASGTIVVPEGAGLLVVGSVAGLGNADLAKARITLTSPAGAETLTLADGAVTASGFSARDLTTPGTDQALEGYFDDVLLLDLPADPTEEDWETAFLRSRGADPEHPLAELPSTVLMSIDAVRAERATWQNSLAAGVTGTGGARPSDGILVYGPRAGEWTIAIEVEAGAGAFQFMAWAQPAGAEREAIAHVADAIAAASGVDVRAGALGSGEGEDPGGSWALEQFRYPPPDTAEFWRAHAIDISYKVIQWLCLRGLFTKAIDVVLQFAGVESLVAVGLVKDNLKTLAIFVVATVYREILRYSAIADLWFWRLAYTLNGPDYYFQIFNLGRLVEVAGFESYTWKNPEIFLRLNDFEEIRILGGNMVRERIPRARWGMFGPYSSPKVATWTIAPSNLTLLKVSGEKDGDCTVESKLGDTPPGTGKLTVVVTTQPAKAVFPVRVAALIALEPETARIKAGQSVTLTAKGHESLPGPFVFAWETGGLYGKISDGAGHTSNKFESSAASVSYTAKKDAHDGANDWVSVTVYQVGDGGARQELGEAVAAIVIRKPGNTCDVTIGVFDAPEGWTYADGTSLDVECELEAGTYVIDPESIKGCMTGADCHLQCLGWEEPKDAGIDIYWHTFDAEGTATGSNYCSSPWYAADTCDAHVAWLSRACAENRCDDGGQVGSCSACNCACGGGNCYPWHGPGKIVFSPVVNFPCTDTAKCYYQKMPGRAAGSYSFKLVSCSSVDDALPNCPGNVPE